MATRLAANRQSGVIVEVKMHYGDLYTIHIKEPRVAVCLQEHVRHSDTSSMAIANMPVPLHKQQT